MVASGKGIHLISELASFKLMELPLEVFFEVDTSDSYPIIVLMVYLFLISQIISYLFPQDLLYLSRASHQLRSMFVSKTSLHMWRAARAQIKDLPNCPQDLSEPEYASLLFESTCQVRTYIPELLICIQGLKDTDRIVVPHVCTVPTGLPGLAIVRIAR